MAKVETFVTDGAGQKLFEALHMSQTLKVGDRVETSGQGGWDDDLNIPASLEDEIAQAFRNVEKVLAPAGASWRDVVHVNSYHVGGFYARGKRDDIPAVSALYARSCADLDADRR